MIGQYTDLYDDRLRDQNFLTRRTIGQRMLFINTVILILAAITYGIMSAIWGNIAGLFMGLILIFCGCIFLAISVRWTKTREHSTAVKVMNVLMCIALIFLALLITVRVATPEYNTDGFPEKCLRESTAKYDCTRVANSNSMRASGMSVPRFNATRASIIAETKTVLESNEAFPFQMQIQQEKKGFLHARVTTLIMGYPDDVYVGVECVNGQAVVQLQSQSRLGQSDAGVNTRRLSGLLTDLENKFKSGNTKCE